MVAATTTKRNGMASNSQIRRCGPALMMSSELHLWHGCLPYIHGSSWIRGFVAEQALDDLNKIAAAFIALQRSVQQSSFEAVILISHVMKCLCPLTITCMWSNLTLQTPQSYYYCSTRHCGHCVKCHSAFPVRHASTCLLRASKPHWTRKRQSCGLWRRSQRPSRSGCARISLLVVLLTAQTVPSGCSRRHCGWCASWHQPQRLSRLLWRCMAWARSTMCPWSLRGPSGTP